MRPSVVGGSRTTLFLTLAFAFAVAGAAYLAKPLLIVDETRYTAVAWEMWQRGSFLVPHLNGAPYSHKPPFLFWLIDAGWFAGGVNAWWPRVLSPLALVVDTLLVVRLARRVWPERTGVAPLAGALFCGMLFPLLFSAWLMFDLWATLWALVGLTALVDAHRGSPVRRTATTVALAIGLGLLTKGPVVLLYLLPPALAARLWSERWRQVLRTALIGLAGGAALALAWALPAAAQGGPEYRDAILWSQTAGRIQRSFGHTRPFWWYLPLLPLMLFPWAWWPRAYRGWGRFLRESPDVAHFLFWSIAPQLLVFSALSSKQPHYLLPLLTLLAVALAGNLASRAETDRLPVLPLLLPGLVGLALASSPLWLGSLREVPPWLNGPLVQRAGLLLLAAVGLSVFACARRPAWRASVLATQSGFLGLAILLALGPGFRETFDVSPAAARVRQAQDAGRPVAFFGAHYSGQLHFLGRLTQPVANPESTGELAVWLASHPDGEALLFVRRDEPLPYGDSGHALLEFGSRYLQLWDATELATALREAAEAVGTGEA